MDPVFDYNAGSPHFQVDPALACPYFMPVDKMENGSWPHPARLPLGCGWNGHCTAPGHEGKTPAQDILESFCNLGYASGCTWAPSERTWDSVRFSVLGPNGGKSREPSSNTEDASRVVYLTYVFERDHRPVELGQLLLDIERDVWTVPHPDPRIQRMAECYLDSYMKRRARLD